MRVCGMRGQSGGGEEEEEAENGVAVRQTNLASISGGMLKPTWHFSVESLASTSQGLLSRVLRQCVCLVKQVDTWVN